MIINWLDNLRPLTPLSGIIRLLLAIIIGGIIGFERGRRGRAAGLRTHILVSIGSAVTAMTGIYIANQYDMGDPTRIASGVVSGSGFLGVGMIMIRGNSQVTGLTTAAGLWTTSTVGLAIGGGFYIVGIVAGISISITVSLLTVLEVNKKKDRKYYIEIDDVLQTNPVISKLKTHFKQIHTIDVIPAKSVLSGHVCIAINIMEKAMNPFEIENLILSLPHVVFVISE